MSLYGGSMQIQGERLIPACWAALFETPFGWAGACGKGGALRRVFLPESGGKRAVSTRIRAEFPEAVFGAAAAVLIGISRVVLGVHYPLDVVGGLVFGAGIAGFF